MIAIGTHKARAVSCGLGKTSTNKEQVGVEFEILEGENAGEHITWFGYFTDAALSVTIKALRACGWTGNDLSDIQGLDKEVALAINHEEYQGKVSARVQWVNEPGGLALKTQMPPDEAKAFAAKMRHIIMAIDPGAPRKVSHHPANASPPPPSDADMPEWAR